MSVLLVTMISLISLIGPARSFSCDYCVNLPREKTAVCKLDRENGALYYPNCTSSAWDSPGRVFLESGQPCALLAGMDVLFEDCSYPASIYRASTGEKLVGRSLRNVQGEDAGEYVCFTDSKTVLGRRNITVNGSAAITPVNECGAGGYTCHTNAQSCGWRDAIIVWNDRPKVAEGYIRGLHVYGQRSINTSVAVKWDNPMRRMTLDDLGIQLYETGDSLLHEFVIFSNGSGHWPESLVDYGNGTQYIDRAIATVHIDAHNSAGSSRLQFKVEFVDRERSKYYWVDGSLPKHQTVALGDNAKFSCEFSTSTDSAQSKDFHVFVRWRMPSGLEEGCNCSIFGDFFNCDCQMSRINITNDPFDYETTDRSVLTINGFVDHVSANDSGSVFSCALATPGDKFEDDLQNLVIQWSKEATLTVGPSLSNIPSGPPADVSIGLYIGIPLALVLGAGTAIAAVSLLWLKRRRNSGSNIESVPLESHPIPDDSTPASTPLATMCLLPSLTASRALHLNNTPPHIATKNPSVDSAMESGSLSSDEDSLSPPFSNRSLEGAHSSIDVPCFLSIPPDVLSRRHICVYISYSQCKADWVLSYLKPLIESFHGTTVSVSDTDMVPGHVVSEERLRLILRADKVVIVCSPDYSSSPWCQFELYQAIAKQPSLKTGRVIPVLCDGCGTPPKVVDTVVNLSDTDPLFPERLREAILRHRYTNSDCFSTVS